MHIYQHIYKNGGTSIRNGFMHCKEHRMLLEKGSDVFIVDQNENLSPFNIEQLELEGNPTFFTGSVDAYKIRDILDVTKKDINYIITLRDPVERLMSAYNYYNFYLKEVYNIDHVLHFSVWFLNRRFLKPVEWETQYIDIIQKKFAVMLPEDWIFLRTNKFDKIDHKKYVEQALEQIDIWKPTILYTDKKYIEKVENITGLQFDQNKQFENVSVNPVKFEHLDNTMQEQVLKGLEHEIGFYNKCIDLN